MYKSYSVEDFLLVTDKCSERLKDILQKRYAELEEMREAINDRYPFEDWLLKCSEVDDEEELIRRLLKHLQTDTEKLKEEKASPAK